MKESADPDKEKANQSKGENNPEKEKANQEKGKASSYLGLQGLGLASLFLQGSVDAIPLSTFSGQRPPELRHL